MQGPYKPFGLIPTQSLGAHDSDWEHVTVRLTVSTPSLHFCEITIASQHRLWIESSCFFLLAHLLCFL